MYTRLKNFVKHLLRPYQYYQVLLVVKDVCGNEVWGFEFRIDQNPTEKQMKNVSKVARKQCGGLSTWFTTYELIRNGRSKDSLVGTKPELWTSLQNDVGPWADVYEITSINLID